MIGKIAFLLLFALLSPLAALAENDCLRDYLALDRSMTWDFSANPRFDSYLGSWHNQDQILYPTKAAVHLWLNGDQLQGMFDFNLNMRSLPYNIYRLEITVGDASDPEQFVKTLDIAQGCNFPQGMGPGDQLDLLPIKIPPRTDGSPWGLEPVRVRVWGHIH